LSEFVHISIGENCLTQNILNKYGLGGEHSCFSSCRSNIELITKIIDDDFKNFTNLDFIKFEKINNSFNGGRNIFYKNDSDIFCPTVFNGFEFTHHDIRNVKQKDSVLRKIQRFKNNMLNDNLVFWYHYRYSENNNIDRLLQLFEKFDRNFKTAKYVIFYQDVSHNKNNFSHIKLKNFNLLKCFDGNIWSGEDNIFAKSFSGGFDEIFNDYKLIEKI
jgi:hypothetical protein